MPDRPIELRLHRRREAVAAGEATAKKVLTNNENR
jgi:hypothetical protein